MIISSLLLSFKSEESSEIVKHWNYMKMAHIKLFSESRIIFMINCSSYHSHHRFVGMHALNLYEEIHHFPILNRQNLCSRYPMNEAFFYTWDLTHRKKWHTFAPMRIKQEGKHTHTHTSAKCISAFFLYCLLKHRVNSKKQSPPSIILFLSFSSPGFWITLGEGIHPFCL